MGRFISFCCMVVMLSVLHASPVQSADRAVLAPGTTLIVLRHADRTDKDLNEKGIARAAALPAALDGIAIDVIFSPGLKRNMDTAAPLAKAHGLEITRRPVETVGQWLPVESAGKTVVWVGNKGNLTTLWSAIGAPAPPPLTYGDLFFVSPDAAGYPVVLRKFVAPLGQ